MATGNEVLPPEAVPRWLTLTSWTGPSARTAAPPYRPSRAISIARTAPRAGRLGSALWRGPRPVRVCEYSEDMLLLLSESAGRGRSAHPGGERRGARKRANGGSRREGLTSSRTASWGVL